MTATDARGERPVIFSAPMVKALLAGRKTMTRRVLSRLARVGSVTEFGRSDTPGYDWHFRDREMRWHDLRDAEMRARLPYAVGDRLWVKEVVAAGACAPPKPSEWAPSFWRREQGTPANPNGLWYAADGLAPERTITSRGPWVSPIFMPRWASRLTLIVEAVKVERLADITDADARAEGFESFGPDIACPYQDGPTGDAADAFAAYWDSIHGKGAFEASPWVAAIRFRTIPQNIDSIANTPVCDAPVAPATAGGRR